MTLNFFIEILHNDNIPVLRVKGEIDVYSCPQLTTSLKNIMEKGHSDFVLNLEDIDYIDSTGLGSIAYAARHITPNNGTINIVCTKPQIRRIFEVSGLDKKNIALFKQEELAVSAFTSKD